MPWASRAANYLKAADLLAGPWRMVLNAATMLNQSKTAHQAEIDAACELIDFWRFNLAYAEQIQALQPQSSPGCWNYVDYRPLEGFVFAVSAVNFTSIGQRGMSLAELALGYVRSRWFVAATIIGVTGVDQLEANVAAARTELDAETLSGVAAIFERYPNPSA